MEIAKRVLGEKIEVTIPKEEKGLFAMLKNYLENNRYISGGSKKNV